MDSILIFVVLIAAFFLFQIYSNLKLQPRKTSNELDEDSLTGFPYALQDEFLSAAELQFFQQLRLVVDERAIICSKVGLGDVFKVNMAETQQFRGYRNKIDRKHVDFLLCHPLTMRPIVAIELDDKSHQRQDRQVRDAFVDQVFLVARLPLLHVPVKRTYPLEDLIMLLAPYLPNPQTPPVVNAPTAKPTNSPTCPKCKSEMLIRTAKTGANVGNQFWGCVNYPACKGILPLTQ